MALGLRRFAAAARRSPGLLELRELEARPEKLLALLPALQASARYADLVGQQVLGAWTTDIGASCGRVYLLQRWADYDSRDEGLVALASDPLAAAAAVKVQELCEAQRSNRAREDMARRRKMCIFAEATAALEQAGLSESLLDASAPVAGGDRPAYELRTYQLKLGYTTVPDFVALYTKGLKEKLAADTTGQSRLVSLMYCEAGAAQLNTVHELWRHNSMQGSLASREASRGAPGWRQAIGSIAEMALTFHSQILRPVQGIGQLQ
ncbi:unnamed protein product [Symbiodinium natans]|uniref:NIPSNAP domain-containing protein n=1 Tax=Symbiodinium natans TaxID=878477 RepID=A0A812M7M1_9DINO|nr:unnamed protein product [Symbiodinium natans]